MTFGLTLFFIFMVFWRPQDWLVPALKGWPILDAVVGLSLLTLLLEANTGRIRFPRRAPQVWLLGGLWVATLLSHVANTYWGGLEDSFLDALKVCFFTVLLLSVLDRPSRVRGIAWVFVIMSCVMAVHALLQQKYGVGFAGQRPMVVSIVGHDEPQARSMFFGIFEDPNDLAQMLATSIPLAFGLFQKRNVVTILVGCLFAWLLIEGVLATHSRGGYVALATVTAVMVALMMPSRWLPYLMVLLLLGALALCPLSARYLDESAHDRVVFWGLANDFFKKNPVFGIGYGMFWQVASDRASHNAFVSCYTTLGMFGYWFWFGLLQLSVVSAWRSRLAMNRPENIEEAWLKRFAGLGIAAIAGFSASAYFLTRDFVYPLFFLFAMLGALVPIAERMLPEDHPPLIRVGRHVWVMGTIGALVSILYIYYSIILLNKAFYG